MRTAKQAEHAQYVLVIVFVVFLVGMALNFYSPSVGQLESDVERLREQVKIERGRTGWHDTCSINVDCQRRLNYLLQNNWVMANDALRKRIIELERLIESGGACTDIQLEECTRNKNKLRDEHQQEHERLTKDQRFLEEAIRVAEEDHNKLIDNQKPDSSDEELTMEEHIRLLERLQAALNS